MLERQLAFLILLIAPAYGATFSKDIAPIVYQHCTPCHHDGGIGPFPLVTYSDVAKHALQIAAVTQSRYMPPWPPVHGYGEFTGDRSLSSLQIQLFSNWVKQNKPEGDLAASPEPPHYDSNWQLGSPDLILRMDKPYSLPADGSDVFRNFILASSLTQSRFVRGFELRLDNPRVVHHANVVLDHTQSLRKRDGADGEAGFPGMDVTTESAPNTFDPDSHFLFFKPGSVLRPEPDDMAWRLDPGTDLIVNLHLQPTGKVEKIQAQIGLYFTDRAPTRLPMLVQLENDGALHIPAGSRDFAVTDSLVLPDDVELLSIYPHAHYLGKSFNAWATLPNGTRVSLIRIDDWDINWQAVYEYKQPIELPKGTRVQMRITYDNSTQNPRNPNHPPELVTFGDRSRDEMGHVWLQLLAKNDASHPDGRLLIQEAVMRRRLEKYPHDFLAYYNLAALLQSQGKINEATVLYQSALKTEPQNATAHNSLATALLMQGDSRQAIEELRKAIELDPMYVNAHYNLGRALAANGSLPQAIGEFEKVLQKAPDDPAANADLGTVEYKLHAYAAALKHLSLAAELSPTDANLQANLGTVLALTGNLPAAEQAFETALKLDPEQSSARTNLQLVRAKLAQR